MPNDKTLRDEFAMAELVNLAIPLQMSRIWEMPNKYTFRMKAVSLLLSEYVVGEWADPFCGRYSPASITNDADELNSAKFHFDGLDFLRSLPNESVDGCLFDPPYSVEQALRKYKPVQNGTAGRAEYWAKCKDEIARITKGNNILAESNDSGQDGGGL